PQGPPPQISQPAATNPASNPTPVSNPTSNPGSNPTSSPVSNSSQAAPAPTSIPDVSSKPTFIFTNSAPFYGKIGRNVTFNWKYSGEFDFLTKSLVALAIYNNIAHINWTINSNLSTNATTATWDTSTIINPTLIEGPYMFSIYNGTDYFTTDRPTLLAQYPFKMYQPGP
ncbi:14843_t:CDS:1, partial [Racocetra fulgida]